ncbi:MAG: Zn-dependent oligopeptidase [Gammaproteobacteria bacterium]|nr:Zn-dependent oligopeptidase [Gammaproteobacteria bacterium]MBT4451560.1 Zn-dependent oligopeptidase [Gammaproteobacteria bacterium]MBT7045496.1 Zn-dependent oligopeptidase [Gammaproteobacteria bacterium]
MPVIISALLISSCSSLSGIQPSEISSNPAIDVSGIKSDFTGEEYTALCEEVLKQAGEDFTLIEQDTSIATLDSVMGKYEGLQKVLQRVRQRGYLKSVHPDEDLRDSAMKCSEKFSGFYSRVGMSRLFYNRLAAIDLTDVSEAEKFMVETTLEDFKRAGVNKDEQTREKLRQLRKEISVIGNKFSKNIQEDVRSVTTTVDGLKGLPADYIKSHPADENGLVTITTNYPDLSPVMKYAESDDLRYRLRIASRSRAYPDNESILKELLTKRYELAQLLGFDNWAEYSMSDNMIGGPKQASEFLTTVGHALKEPVKKELEIELAQLRQINPDADIVQVWQSGYVDNLIRKQLYDLDAKEVREYFDFQNVRDGILKLTENLFGVEIRPWKTMTWHEDVETYEILENGELLGRFYLDNHPREGKYKHAAHFTLRTGIKDKQIPLSALAQNFPKGLMEHGQVETFLHEFGHLLHNMFAGKQKWRGMSGMGVESDFVEAPSQMLEEWVWDYDTLKSFAKNKNGKIIPRELVAKMNKARDFGQATSTAAQLYFANLSLSIYDRDPDSFDLMTITKKLSAEFSPYPFVEGTAFYCNFGHLRGYSSNYYTYQWSLAIATDMFSRFKKEGIHNAQVAREYREKVLAPGSSKPARQTVTDFLGREFSTEAYIEKLKAG